MMFAFISIAVFFMMEGISWCTHKYVMHGFGWFLHEDHHQPRYDGFEKNDVFFVIFAIPSMLLFYFSSVPGKNLLPKRHTKQKFVHYLHRHKDRPEQKNIVYP